MCRCISVNQPQPDQTVGHIALPVPARFGSSRAFVQVDACIAPLIVKLWQADIFTRGCCCGHGGRLPRMVNLDKVEDIPRANAIIASLGDSAFVWEDRRPHGD